MAFGGVLLRNGLSEHCPRMQLFERNPETLWENSKKARQESWDLSFLENTELVVLECACLPPAPRCSG